MKNICVVGCGYWGKNLVRNFYELGVLRSIYDEDKSKAIALSEKYKGVAVKDKYSDIMSDPNISGFVIATPPETHYKLAMQALKNDKHIFVEKPVTLLLDDAKELLCLSQLKGKAFLVGHILEYHPAVIKLRELVDSGNIGDIKEIYSHRLNTGKVRQIENV